MECFANPVLDKLQPLLDLIEGIGGISPASITKEGIHNVLTHNMYDQTANSNHGEQNSREAKIQELRTGAKEMKQVLEHALSRSFLHSSRGSEGKYEIKRKLIQKLKNIQLMRLVEEYLSQVLPPLHTLQHLPTKALRTIIENTHLELLKSNPELLSTNPNVLNNDALDEVTGLVCATKDLLPGLGLDTLCDFLTCFNKYNTTDYEDGVEFARCLYDCNDLQSVGPCLQVSAACCLKC